MVEWPLSPDLACARMQPHKPLSALHVGHAATAKGFCTGAANDRKVPHSRQNPVVMLHNARTAGSVTLHGVTPRD